MRANVVASFAVLTALALGGCYTSTLPPETVRLIGYLWNYDDEKGIGGASFVATSRAGEPLASGTTYENGYFEAVGLEKELPVALVFERAGYSPAVFTGDTAQRDALMIFANFLPHMEHRSATEEMIDEYSAAVGVGPLMVLGSNGGGGIVRGVARNVSTADGGLSFPPAAGVDVDVIDGSGTAYQVYYANENGEIDPALEVTGDGTFVAFAVVATAENAAFSRGVGAVTVRATTSGGTVDETTIALDGGVTEFDVFVVP